MIIFLTVLFGWLGVYRFYKKQYGLGLLYLFTSGLFCIGWFYDIYCAVTENGKSNNTNYNTDDERNTINFICEKSKQSTNMFELPQESDYRQFKIADYLKSEIKRIKNINKNMYFYLNNINNYLGIIKINDSYKIDSCIEINYSDIKGFDFQTDTSVVTSSAGFGSAVVSGYSVGSAVGSSSTSNKFKEATLVIKTKIADIPIIYIKIFDKDDFIKIKSLVEIIEDKNKDLSNPN